MTKIRKVYGIINGNGHWYTGDRSGGEPVFSPNKDDALEMDAEEAETEFRGGRMPKDARLKVHHEYLTK